MQRPNRWSVYNHRSEKGFTLLEIMISLGILSIIFTLIYGTFNAVYRGVEHMEEEADTYQLARLGIYHMANHLSMLHVGPTQPDSPASAAPAPFLFRGEGSERLEGDESLPNDTLVFSTVSHGRTMPGAPESDRKTIRYSLMGNTLIQESLLSNGNIIANEIGGPVAGLRFRYLNQTGREWVDTWDADENDHKPPQAVEIEFILKKENRAGRRFKTWVDIPMSRRS